MTDQSIMTVMQNTDDRSSGHVSTSHKLASSDVQLCGIHKTINLHSQPFPKYIFNVLSMAKVMTGGKR